MRGKKRNKCIHCGKVFPRLPKDDPNRESRIDHMNERHPEFGRIDLSNFLKHFDYED